MLLLLILLAVLAIGLEVGAFLLFMGTIPIGESAALAWLLHALSAAAAAAFVYILLPQRYKQPPIWTAAFLFVTSLCIPLTGLLGIATGLLLGLHRQQRERDSDWQRQTRPDLPFKPVAVSAQSVYLRGSLASMVSFFDDVPLRLRAVMATRHLPDRRSVSILRHGLKDPVDEIRLLSYSLLSGKEKKIDSSIQSLRTTLVQEGLSASQRAGYAEQVAALHLEQADIGLVEGEVRRYVLEQARSFIDIALQGGGSAARYFLSGRIRLALGQADEAEAAFVAAETAGIPGMKIAPYRAEVAFIRRDFDRVRQHVRRIGGQASAVPILKELVEFWS